MPSTPQAVRAEKKVVDDGSESGLAQRRIHDMSNKNNSAEHKDAWEANKNLGSKHGSYNPQRKTRKYAKFVKGTFAVRTLQSLAAKTLGEMARGKKKTMTPAALKARRNNGKQPKVNFAKHK